MGRQLRATNHSARHKWAFILTEKINQHSGRASEFAHHVYKKMWKIVLSITLLFHSYYYLYLRIRPSVSRRFWPCFCAWPISAPRYCAGVISTTSRSHRRRRAHCCPCSTRTFYHMQRGGDSTRRTTRRSQARRVRCEGNHSHRNERLSFITIHASDSHYNKFRADCQS